MFQNVPETRRRRLTALVFATDKYLNFLKSIFIDTAMRKFRHCRLAGCGLVFCVAIFLLASVRPASAYLSGDVVTIVSGYTNSFYVVSGTNGYFRNSQTDASQTYFWQFANEIESVIDAYQWTTNAAYLGMITNLLNGFINNNGANWSYNGYNDDDLWAVMAFARGGAITGKTNYCDIAKSNFDMVYARAWDTNLGGGLYWLYPNNASKNACVNGPGAIAASLLYQIYGDTNYWNKATNIYYWERAVLYNSGTGRIYDNINTNGAVDQTPTTYNQGTFIGAADFLGQTGDATLAANYTINSMGAAGFMPQYGVAQNNSIFNSIFIRWMNRFVLNRGLQSSYQAWLQNQANAAWNGRRTNDNLSWCQWPQATPVGTNFYSYDCISSFEAMIAVPPTQGTNLTVVTLNTSDNSSASSFQSGLNWAGGVVPSATNDFLVSGQILRTPQDSMNHYFAGSSLTLSNAAILACKNTGGGAGISVGTDLFLDNGEVADWSGNSTTFYAKLTLRVGGGRLDPQANSFTISALIGGSGALTITAADSAHTNGTVIFSGFNTYTGGTVINAAHIVQLSGGGTLGDIGGSLTFSNAAALGYGVVDLNANDLGVGNLSGTGGKVFNNQANVSTLTIGNSNATGGIFQGSISGNIELVKTGSGTLTLAKNTNTCYAGANVAGGTLVVSNALLAVSNYLSVASVGNVNSGTNIATLDLSAATNFTANVGAIQMGVTTNTVGGSPVIIGTMKLGTNNYLNAATSIIFGDMGNTFNTNMQSVTTAANGNTTLLSPILTVGGSKCSATFALGGGAKLNLGNIGNRTALNIAVSPRGGSGSYTGSFDCSAGSFNGYLSSLTIGQLAGAGSGSETGSLTLSGNAANHLDVSGGGTIVTVGSFLNGSSAGVAIGTLTISNLDSSSVVASTNNGVAILIAATTNSIGTLNLNGGTLKITTTNSAVAGGAGASSLNLNGVKLVAGTNCTSFITNITTATLNLGGVTFDTAGFNLTIPQALSAGGGGLTKLGAGKLTLSKANTFAGSTVVGVGTLALLEPGNIASSAQVIVSNAAVLDVTARNDQTLTLNNGAALHGGGTILGKLNALAGSIITPGDAVGVLTVQSSVTLAGTLVMELNRANAQPNDKLVSTTGIISGGGILTVTNLGAALQAGDVFSLFNQPVSGFAPVIFPTLLAGNVWQNNIAVDGSIRVVSTNAVSLAVGTIANQLSLSWPSDHIGWRLQTQTNNLTTGLNTNWFDVANSTVTNQVALPINVSNGSVFFRLIYP
jgi:autotransporter-associated beta strand protein